MEYTNMEYTNMEYTYATHIRIFHVGEYTVCNTYTCIRPTQSIFAVLLLVWGGYDK